MRRPLTEEERRLMQIIHSYKENIREINEDEAPEEVKESLKRLKEIGRENDKLELSLM